MLIKTLKAPSYISEIVEAITPSLLINFDDCELSDDLVGLSALSATRQRITRAYEHDFDKVPVELFEAIKNLYPDWIVSISNCIHYPKGGVMGWHTNEECPAKRVYVTWADEDNQSFFRYLKDGAVVDSFDIKGVLIREFDIPKLPEQFWHCVYSNCNRFSFGFRLEK